MRESLANGNEDRFPEEDYGEKLYNQIKTALKAGIDIEKINALMPELYYPSGEFGVLTKQDLLDAV